LPSLFDVQGNRIDEIHDVAHLRQRKRVRAGGSADIEDNGRRRRKETTQEVEGSSLLPARKRAFQATGLLVCFVETADFRFLMRSQEQAYLYCARPSHSRAFGDDESDVVSLFVRAELPDLTREICHQLL
jgi:hypothetical protein